MVAPLLFQSMQCRNRVQQFRRGHRTRKQRHQLPNDVDFKFFHVLQAANLQCSERNQNTFRLCFLLLFDTHIFSPKKRYLIRCVSHSFVKIVIRSQQLGELYAVVITLLNRVQTTDLHYADVRVFV